MIDFPEDLQFFNVEGIPVTIGNVKGHPYSAAWDKPESRPFDPDSARRNGKPICKNEFIELVEEFRAKPQQKSKVGLVDKKSLIARIVQYLR